MCNATLGACIFQQTKIAKTSTVWQESAWVFPAGVLVTRAGEITHRHRCAERRPRRWGVRGSIRRRRSRARTCWSRRIGRRSLVRCGDGVHAHALSLSLSLSFAHREWAQEREPKQQQQLWTGSSYLLLPRKYQRSFRNRPTVWFFARFNIETTRGVPRETQCFDVKTSSAKRERERENKFSTVK